MKILNYKYNIDREKIKIFYDNFGFVIIKKFFKIKTIKNIKKQLLRLSKKKIKNKYFYYEKINKKLMLRRIEKVSDFSKKAKKIIYSKRIFGMIRMLENGNFRLLKDKINFKFSGSKGYLPHIDGHFLWKDEFDTPHFGWKKYSKNFINFVIPLEKTDKRNGCLYIATKNDTKKIGLNFNKIIKKLDSNKYTIRKNFMKNLKFLPVELDHGDVCVFNWKCAHFSKNNFSKRSRIIFYLTYCSKNKLSNVRKIYYLDKHESKGSDAEKSLLHN